MTSSDVSRRFDADGSEIQAQLPERPAHADRIENIGRVRTCCKIDPASMIFTVFVSEKLSSAYRLEMPIGGDEQRPGVTSPQRQE
jgi:hypothetical protein